MEFGSAFYKGLADGEPIDAALVEARGKLAYEGLNTVDFATPVLFLADPGCLRMDQAAFRPAPPPPPPGRPPRRPPPPGRGGRGRGGPGTPPRGPHPGPARPRPWT